METINKIISSKLVANEITMILSINNLCNFRCSYCHAGQRNSQDHLSLEDTKKIIGFIKELFKTKKNSVIRVDINGGEPTMHHNFLEILDGLLSVDEENGNSLHITISTNGFNLIKFDDWFRINSKHHNISKIEFNISYHFFEYGTKENVFIEIVRMLKKYNINFKTKFLLPDQDTTLDVFLKRKSRLLESGGIDESDCTYDLIIDTLGDISKTYALDILDYFYNERYQTIPTAKCNPEEDKGIELVFEDGEKRLCTHSEVRTLGFNTFKGYNCYYVSDSFIQMHISHFGYVTFGYCYTLDKIRYTLDEAKEVLFAGEKSIVCPEKKCACGICFKKTKNASNEKIGNLEALIQNLCKKIFSDFEIKDIAVSIGKNFQIILKSDGLIIYIIVEKVISDSYVYIKDGVGFYFQIKNENNIFVDIKDIDNNIQQTINKGLKVLSSLDFYRGIFESGNK